jgi:rhamnulokinase
MKQNSFLAIDLGAESGRAILGRLDNSRLALEELRRFPNAMLPKDGHLFWNVRELFDNIKKGIRAAAAAASVRSMAIDTWGVDFALLRKGTLLGLPHTYRDIRTEGVMEKFFRIMPKETVYGHTGIQFMPFNTLFQLFSMKPEHASLLREADTLLFMPDIFNFFLTGKKATEFTYATTSQLLNPVTMTWEKTLFDVLEISPDIMQKPVLPGTVLGPIVSSVCGEIGIGPIEVMTTASHDTAAAVAAIPAQGKEWMFISSGTWSLVGREIEKPIISDSARACNFTNEGGVDGTFRFLKNVVGLWLVQQCRKAWKIEKEYSYAELTDLAFKAAPFMAFIDPGDPAFLNPENMPGAIISYCRRTGQQIPETKGEIIRCALESLALKYRSILDQLRTFSPVPIKIIHMIGGGTKNRLLCQLTADATGLPVIAGPEEATAAGNIMMQAKSCGMFSSIDEIREVIADSFECQSYAPRDNTLWDAANERFLLVMKR